MALPIYNTLEDLEEKITVDWQKSAFEKYYVFLDELLREYYESYREKHTQFSEMHKTLYAERDKLMSELQPLIPENVYNDLLHDTYHNYIEKEYYYSMEDVMKNPEIIIDRLPYDTENKSIRSLLFNLFDFKKRFKDYWRKSDEYETEFDKIMAFLIVETKKEEMVLGNLQNIQLQPIERQPKEKIVINGNLQTLGYIFNQLISGGYIEPIVFNTGKNNNTATAQMFLEHFEFTENPHEQPSVEYLKKTIFHNSLSMKKQEDFIIPHIEYYDPDK